MRLIRGWFAIPLWQRVVGGLILGVALGLLWPEGAGAIRLIGDLFVRLIKMLVVPVVLVTIAAGIATLGDPRRLGSIGLRTVGLFAATTLVSVSIGMAAGLILRPGAAMSLGGVVPHVLGAAVTPADQLLSIVPLNIVEALVRGDMLAIIFVAVGNPVAWRNSAMISRPENPFSAPHGSSAYASTWCCPRHNRTASSRDHAPLGSRVTRALGKRAARAAAASISSSPRHTPPLSLKSLKP